MTLSIMVARTTATRVRAKSSDMADARVARAGRPSTPWSPLRYREDCACELLAMGADRLLSQRRHPGRTRLVGGQRDLILFVNSRLAPCLPLGGASVMEDNICKLGLSSEREIVIDNRLKWSAVLQCIGEPREIIMKVEQD